MKYILIINTAGFSGSPILDIANALQRQSEKLLRWADATTWSDTLTDMQGKPIGVAKWVKVPSQGLEDLIESQLSATAAKTLMATQPVSFIWDSGDNMALKCTLEYDPPTEAFTEGGVVIEPPSEGQVRLYKAYNRGVDVTSVLKSSVVAKIEEAAKVNMGITE